MEPLNTELSKKTSYRVSSRLNHVKTPMTEETSFCTLTHDSDLEANAWQNAVKALSGKNKALIETKNLIEQSLIKREKELEDLQC